jgi:hypothetical protein
MFFFVRKKVVIDCYIDNEIMAEAYPIRKAIKYTPDWWTKLEGVKQMLLPNGLAQPFSTVKKCLGFTELYKSSWMLPMWSDFIIETDQEGRYRYAFPTSNHDWTDVRSHNPDQYTGAFTNYTHIKLNNPWLLFDTKKTNTSFMFTPADWSLVDSYPDIRPMIGIIDFVRGNGANVNLLLPKKQNRIELKANTPLMHFIPLTEREVEFKTHVVTTAEYKELRKKNEPRFYNRFHSWTRYV